MVSVSEEGWVGGVESGVVVVLVSGSGGGSRAQSQAEKVKVGGSRALGKGFKCDIIGPTGVLITGQPPPAQHCLF